MFGHEVTMFMSWLAMVAMLVLPFVLLLAGLRNMEFPEKKWRDTHPKGR